MFGRVLNRTELLTFPGLFRFRAESRTATQPANFDSLIHRLASPESERDCFPAALTEARQLLSQALGCHCRVYLKTGRLDFAGQADLQTRQPLQWPALTGLSADDPAAFKPDPNSEELTYFGTVRDLRGQMLARWCVQLSGNHEPPQRVAATLQTWQQTLVRALRLRQSWSARLHRELEDERLCYAAELHDTVAQTLGYLRMQSARLLSKCRPQLDERSCPIIEQIETQSQLACRQAREIINGTRAVCRHGNLNTDIAAVVIEFESLSSLVFEQDLRFDSALLGAEPRRHCLMMVREALSNAVRHARASHVRISNRQIGTAMQLCIEDNGVGLTSTRPRSDSFGLQILQERAQRIKASLEVDERDAGGTRIAITLEETHFD